jgi:hypothetical protein
MERSLAEIAESLSESEVAALKALGLNVRMRRQIYETSELAYAWRRLEDDGIVAIEAAGVDPDRGVWVMYAALDLARPVYEIVEGRDAKRHLRESTPWGGHPVPDIEMAAIRFVAAAAANRRRVLTKWRGGMVHWREQLTQAVDQHPVAGPLAEVEIGLIEGGRPRPWAEAVGDGEPTLEQAAALFVGWTEAIVPGRVEDPIAGESARRASNLLAAVNRLPDVETRIEAAWRYLTSRTDMGQDKAPEPVPPDLITGGSA